MANDGKWLEKAVQDALKDLQSKTPSFFHRFPDSRAAASWLQAQPGDYLWLLPGIPAILVEVKSTDRSAPLKGLLDSGQCGKHRLWQRAGHLTAFIYGDRAKGVLRWYDGKSVLGTGSTLAALWEGELDGTAQMLRAVASQLKA
jgi:hypothetical protein